MTQKYTVNIRDLDRLFATAQKLSGVINNVDVVPEEVQNVVENLKADVLLVKGGMSSDRHRHEWTVSGNAIHCDCGAVRRIKDLQG